MNPRDLSPEARRLRAQRRAERMCRLGPGEDVPLPEKGLARLELAFILSKAAWTMTGKPWPTLPRDQWPVRRVLRVDSDA